MKHIYSGNIDSLTSTVDRINNKRTFRFFPTNEITHAKLENNVFEVSGILFKGVGQIEEQKDSVSIDLKVRLKSQFVFIGLFVIILLSGFIWGENVNINGDSDPALWKRIGFVSVGLVIFIAIPSIILKQLKYKFKKKVVNLIK